MFSFVSLMKAGNHMSNLPNRGTPHTQFTDHKISITPEPKVQLKPLTEFNKSSIA